MSAPQEEPLFPPEELQRYRNLAGQQSPDLREDALDELSRAVHHYQQRLGTMRSEQPVLTLRIRMVLGYGVGAMVLGETAVSEISGFVALLAAAIPIARHCVNNAEIRRERLLAERRVSVLQALTGAETPPTTSV